MSKFYMAVAEEMKKELTNRGIDFSFGVLYDGVQFMFPKYCEGDVVCHCYSYGGKNGLWESYRFPWDNGDVTGWLATKDFVDKLEKMIQENNGIT